ncbi:unnamed protein product [Medioppia subpectinata]|uniref:Nuclear receptor domain-containing protein n=1 Tax=Medioppia subpectinata TaxID=1979941 RepID=A0A7R9KBI9_9ACAR|nr:unnamed protein product [Medioppia subpectinata]CAG2100064.1 unnamed protein product [Medioppia subpectinata]
MIYLFSTIKWRTKTRAMFAVYAVIRRRGKFRCYLGGNCLINLKNRKTCRKCRLDKSFAVGMKIELFFTDEQKQKRNSIIENNRKRKLTETPVTNVEIAVSTASLSPQTSATFSEDMATLSCSSQSSMDFNNDISSDNSFANILIPENTLNNITNDTNSYDFSQAIVPIVRPITDYSNNFNELEGNRLNELLNGIKILAIPAANSGKRFELNTFPDAMKALITRQETSIQKLVEMCKTIGPFKALCEHDQIILIKYGAIKVKTLRMLLDFDYETQAWTLPNVSLFTIIVIFIMNMGLDWDSETLIIDLLTAILLFNPNQPNLINKHMIKY